MKEAVDMAEPKRGAAARAAQEPEPLSAEALAEATPAVISAPTPVAEADPEAATAAQVAEQARREHVQRSLDRMRPKDSKVVLRYNKKQGARVGALPARDIYEHEFAGYFPDQETLDSVVATEVYTATNQTPALPKRAEVARKQREAEAAARERGDLTG
jgi:hypothetical protein